MNQYWKFLWIVTRWKGIKCMKTKNKIVVIALVTCSIVVGLTLCGLYTSAHHKECINHVCDVPYIPFGLETIKPTKYAGYYYDDRYEIIYKWDESAVSGEYETMPDAYLDDNGIPYKYDLENETFIEYSDWKETVPSNTTECKEGAVIASSSVDTSRFIERGPSIWYDVETSILYFWEKPEQGEPEMKPTFYYGSDGKPLRQDRMVGCIVFGSEWESRFESSESYMSAIKYDADIYKARMELNKKGYDAFYHSVDYVNNMKTEIVFKKTWPKTVPEGWEQYRDKLNYVRIRTVSDDETVVVGELLYNLRQWIDSGGNTDG